MKIKFNETCRHFYLSEKSRKGDPHFTIEYMRKLAKQIVLNSKLHGQEGVEDVSEELAQHIYAGGTVCNRCYHTIHRKNCDIMNSLVWGITTQGRPLWRDIYMSRTVPVFKGKREE